jgi:nucleoside-diphosphate-sugar epimerase
MTRILVTGGAGAIGSNLTAELIAHGHDVTVLDDLSSGHRGLIPRGARVVIGSVADDRALAEAFEPAPELVFHLAALFANQNSVEHPERDLMINGLGLIKVLEYAKRCGARKLLYTSSSCVYGSKPVMRETDTDFAPDTPYAITKLLGEKYCRFWSEFHGLDTVIVRLFNTYGPSEHPGRYRNVIPNFLQMAMAGEPLPITGTGEETRDFNYVSDTVAGIIAAVESPTRPGDIFNLASGRETTIRALAETINEITGNRAGLAFKPRRGWDHVLTRRGDTSKAERMLGYRPKVSIEQGLQRTYDWLRTVVPAAR